MAGILTGLFARVHPAVTLPRSKEFDDGAWMYGDDTLFLEYVKGIT
jgi:hypothetical protein